MKKALFFILICVVVFSTFLAPSPSYAATNGQRVKAVVSCGTRWENGKLVSYKVKKITITGGYNNQNNKAYIKTYAETSFCNGWGTETIYTNNYYWRGDINVYVQYYTPSGKTKSCWGTVPVYQPIFDYKTITCKLW